VQPQSGSADSNFAPDFPNLNITSDPVDDQDGPAIAIDQTHPERLILGEIDYRSYDVLWNYSSTDRGQSWAGGALPSTRFANATDPGLTFDGEGTAFFSNVFYDDVGIPAPANEVGCYTSSDGGVDWSVPNVVSADAGASATTLADRDFMAVDRDPNSPNYTRVYVAWIEIADSASRVVEAFSTDHGVSWSKKIAVSPSGKLFQGPIPACAPNGDLYITYIDRDTATQNILVSRSTDGGVSFSNPIAISHYNNLGPVLPDNFNGHPAIKDSLSVNSFPAIAINHSSATSAKIYVTWCAKANDGQDHVYLSSSTDHGNSWSVPEAIDNDTNSKPTDKFFSWIAVDQSNGDVGIVFYDSRNDPDSNEFVDTYMSLSTDEGATFVTRRISGISFDPDVTNERVFGSLRFFGDYIGLDGFQRNWYPTWTDTRLGSDQDVYVGIVRPYAPESVKDLATRKVGTAAEVSWSFDAKTTFGFSLVGYHFVVRREDGKFSRVIPSTSFSIFDSTVVDGSSYTYCVQVIEDSGDSSLTECVAYVPNSEVTPLLYNISLFTADSPSPNPVMAGNEQSLSLSLNQPLKVHITIVNSLGQVVETIAPEGLLSFGHSTIQISFSHSGVYWLEILGSDGSASQFEVLKSVVLK
jgi:hypothetical protein